MAVHRLHVVWKRARAGAVTEDVALTTHDFQDNGSLSGAALTAAYAAVENACAVWFTAFDEHIVNSCTMDQWRWYVRDPATGLWGEPDRVTEVETPGTSASAGLPPQAAMSVTEKTALRKHWGRFYIPSWSVTVMSGEGLLATSVITAVAEATRVWYAAAESQGLNPVVVTRPQPPLTFDAMPITQLQVDNIADVIRRRRWENATQRIVRTLSVPA